jgi:hypothetical protein
MESNGQTLRGIATPTPPTDEQIRARAYQIFLARAGRPGDPEADWIQAQQELTAVARRAQAEKPVTSAASAADGEPKLPPRAAAPKRAPRAKSR